MSRLYPLPSYAASIYISGDQLHIGLEPLEEDGRGRQIIIPLDQCGIEPTQPEHKCEECGHHQRANRSVKSTQRGWLALLTLLRERAHLGHVSSISTPANPTQWNIDQILRSFGGEVKYVGSKKKVSDTMTLEDIEGP